MQSLILIFLIISTTSCAQFYSLSKGFKNPGSELADGGKLTGTPDFVWPVKDYKMTRGYIKPTKTRKKHFGLDLANKLNTPILASHLGLVVYAGSGYSGYGKVVILEYNDRWATLYAHLNKFNVKEGQYVNPGDMIGYMGTTGRSTGVHLHFELIKDKYPVDPLNFLK